MLHSVTPLAKLRPVFQIAKKRGQFFLIAPFPRLLFYFEHIQVHFPESFDPVARPLITGQHIRFLACAEAHINVVANRRQSPKMIAFADREMVFFLQIVAGLLNFLYSYSI
jgi:hypothetical protein